MKSTYLIQRLNNPVGFMNPFSFGERVYYGGFTDEGMTIVNKLYSFDYMGAAEFEWGAVPMALQSLAILASKKKLATTSINKQIFIISPADVIVEITKWVLEASKKDYGHGLREYLGLKGALDGKNQYSGWLKIEGNERCIEPFIFFVDKTMYQNTCKLFNLKS